MQSSKVQKEVQSVNCCHCNARAKDEKLLCICTRVVFCSTKCKEEALVMKTHKCPGAPPDISEKVRNLRKELADGTLQVDRAWREEFERTVTTPMLAHPNGPRYDRTQLDEWIRCSELPGPCGLACSYQAGCALKQRVLGCVDSIDIGGGDKGVLESNALSFKYFKKAAEGGLGLAMQSLANSYEKGVGVAANRRLAQEWYWRAVLIGSANSAKDLTTKGIMEREFMATLEMSQNLAQHGEKLRGESVQMNGPNLASLLFMFHQELKDLRFRLPPFFATVPTYRVDFLPQPGTIEAPLLVMGGLLKSIAATTKLKETMGTTCIVGYGRRGTAAGATSLSLGAATRPLDTQRFIIPPRPVHDDYQALNHSDSKQMWEMCSMMADMRFVVECIHSEKERKTSSRRDRRYVVRCVECIKDAKKRMAAVASGSVVLSETEALCSRGHMAIIRRPDGTLYSETFKDYGRFEVEMVLAALIALPNEMSETFAYPLFIAQDPNLYWPLIYDHGCLRAAMAHVAPHIDWIDRLGPIISPPLPSPIVPGFITPGTILRRCGNEACLRLEIDESQSKKKARGEIAMMKCGRCARRAYCSKECLAADWTLHKTECTISTPKKSVSTSGGLGSLSLHDDGENDDENDALPTEEAEQDALVEEGLRDDNDHPLEGETVIVYGLQAHPEWNHCVGLVDGPVTETGRYPTLITFPSSSSSSASNRVSAKPTNLHRVTVAIEKELLPIPSSSSSSSSSASASSSSSSSSSPPSSTQDTIVVLHRYTCSLHEEELCGRCCVDFRIANHLRKVVKLQVINSTSKKGNHMIVPLNVIESVAATHFAKNPFREKIWKDFAYRPRRKKEDEGTEDETKRTFEGLLSPFANILRDALLVKNPTLSVAALIVGLSTFGGNLSPPIRPQVPERLQKLLQLSSTSS